jgi:hypothetical protein
MVPRPAEAHLSARVLARPERAVVTTAATTVAVTATETPERHAPEADAGDTTDTTGRAGTAGPQGRVLERRRARGPVRDDAGEDEGMDDHDAEGRVATAGYDDEAYAAPDDEGHRPRAYRPGRGGFDADAAAAAAHARYSFRQRVALGLIAVAVLSLLAALVVAPVLWWLHVVTDIGLVGYLVFLRRQTRIEDEVRRRRLARLTGERRALEARRERQVEHEARLADVDRWGSADDLDEDHHDSHESYDEADDRYEDDDEGDVDVPAPRWIAPRTPAPEVPDGMELVADTDEDPAFHDLSDSRVPAYRRMAAGA